MRLVIATAITLFVTVLFFFIIKFWGLGQRYIDYKHPFYAVAETELPLEFYKPNLTNVNELMASSKNLFLDIAATLDDKLVVVLYKKDDMVHFRAILSTDLAGKGQLLETFKKNLKGRRVIFNLIENPLKGTDLILAMAKEYGFDKSEHFILTATFEAPLKDMKERAPIFLYGTSQAEILRIKTYEGFHLLEALNLRADVVIHPATFYKQEFFTPELQDELKRRFKRIIVGPVSESEKESALKIKPFGVIYF